MQEIRRFGMGISNFGEKISRIGQKIESTTLQVQRKKLGEEVERFLEQRSLRNSLGSRAKNNFAAETLASGRELFQKARTLYDQPFEAIELRRGLLLFEDGQVVGEYEHWVQDTPELWNKIEDGRANGAVLTL